MPVFGFIKPDDSGVDALRTPLQGTTHMGSSGKKRTTMAKLTRESRLRERRLDKQAKKDARKLAPAHDPDAPGDSLDATTDESAPTGSGQAAPEALNQTLVVPDPTSLTDRESVRPLGSRSLP
jgi:hypothetical protein